MKKNFFRWILAFILSFVLFLPSEAFSITKSNDYSIEDYEINMKVKENNTFEITEKISAYFRMPKHGIYRKLPLRNSITRTDGTKSNNRAKITNVSVNEEYEISKKDGFEIIKIGSPTETLTGRHVYTIQYTYDIGKDPLKNADELYFNLIGNEWDTEISNVQFRITLPKDFDPSLLGFSSGLQGATNSSNVSYQVEGNTIYGVVRNTLEAGEGVTVRLTLPEGYFVGASSHLDIYSIIAIATCFLCIFIAYLLWMRYGKDEEVIETVEFYPPEGYNSAEIGFLYNGVAENEGVISLLVYFADKGYLKMEEETNGFRITKLKEYDGENENEKLFFEGLFKAGQSITKSDLYNKFYTTLNEIKSKLNAKENKNKIWEESASGKIKWLKIMIGLIFALITIKPVIEYSSIEMVLFALVFTGVGFYILFSSILGKNPILFKVFGIIFGIGFGVAPWRTLVWPALKNDTLYIATYLIGIISVAILISFIKIMPKRTFFGNEMLGKLRGFKRFLETAEKPQLESLVEKNPEYFYHILPYTYALGVSKVWIGQFETIAIQEPNWYSSSRPFTIHEFDRFMTHTMNSAQSAMSSSPSSSGSGGTSGGGSSGGGSGGGGGGSW